MQPSTPLCASIRSKATSIFNTIKSSVFHWSCESSPTQDSCPGLPQLRLGLGPRLGEQPPVWEVAAQFLEHLEGPEPAPVESMSMEMDLSMPEIPLAVEAQLERTKEPWEDKSIGESMEYDEESESEPDKAGDSDKNGHDEAHDNQKYRQWEPPTIDAARVAHTRIKAILHLQRNNGIGHKDPKLNLLLRNHLEAMQRFLWRYIDFNSEFYNKWMAASLDTARSSECGVWFARRLREWSSAFIEDEDNLPFNIYRTWNESQLEDEDLKQGILIHLQEIGKYISAMDLVRYTNREDVQRRYKMKKGISERTARNWFSRRDYRFTVEPSGQYVDGHESDDVVDY